MQLCMYVCHIGPQHSCPPTPHPAQRERERERERKRENFAGLEFPKSFLILHSKLGCHLGLDIPPNGVAPFPALQPPPFWRADSKTLLV